MVEVPAVSADWDACWEDYRIWREDAEESILTMHAPDEDVPLTSITFAAEVVALVRRWGGQIEANGEVTWPTPRPPDGVAVDCAEDIQRNWPHTRELLAFERWLEQDLAAVTRG